MPQSKRILLISHASQMEGAERSLLDVVRYLKSAEGWSVEVALPKEGALCEALETLGIRWNVFKYGWWRSKGDALSTDWCRHQYNVALQMQMHYAEFAPHVVYTNTSVIGVGAVVAQLMNVPHIWHVRELLSGNIFEKHGTAKRRIGDFISSSASEIIFNSFACQNDWRSYVSLPGKVIRNYIAVPQVIQKTRGGNFFEIAVVGSVLPIKNQGLVIEALVKLRKLRGELEFRLKIIGPHRSESYLEGLKRLAVQNQISDIIEWIGYSADPWHEARRADVVVVPGNKEGFGRVCAEALLHGFPVVAAEGGGTDEQIIDGQTGLLFEANNTDALVVALKQIIDYPELAADLGISGKSHIEGLCGEAQTLKLLAQTVHGQIEKEAANVLLKTLLHPFTPPSSKWISLKQSIKKFLGKGYCF